MNKYQKSPYNLDDDATVSLVDEVSLWSAPFGLKLLDRVIYKERLTVLDIGFGPGFPLVELALRLGNKSKVFGIDPWRAAAARAKIKIEAFGLENVQLIEGFAENIPLPDGSVDLIVSNNGINNVQDLPRVLVECARVAKAGAQFVATVNLPETMAEFYRIFENVLMESGLADVVPKMHRHIHHKRRPFQELETLFQDHHFSITRSEFSSFNFRYANGTAMFNHPFIRYAFMDNWIDLLPPDRVDDVFAEIEKRMNTIAAGEGGWALTVPFVVIDASRK